MSLAINIQNTHLVTVTNIVNTQGVAVTEITSATCTVLDANNVVVESQPMQGDNVTRSCNIGPLDLVERAAYKIRVSIVADGATMTGESKFKASYRDMSDGSI